MSLDDETPTQYLGADAVQLTIRGKEMSIPHAEFIRLSNSGALTDEEMLNAKQWGLSLAELLAEANRTYPRVIALDNIPATSPYDGVFAHIAGCASSRGRDCICEYLAQWNPKETP